MTTFLTRDSDGEAIVLDVVMNYATNSSATVARHPVEYGASVADHRNTENLTVNLACRITRTPLDTAAGSESGADRVQKVWDFLNTVGRVTNDDRGTLTLSSDSDKIDTIGDLVLTQWPKTINRLGGAGFQLSLTQVRFATITHTAIPDRQITSSATETEVASENGTDEPSDTDKSTLATGDDNATEALRGIMQTLGLGL